VKHVILCLLFWIPGMSMAETIQIAAASDLTYCLESLNKAFVAYHPDAELKVSTGSSGNFFTQISQGAPFDVFLSADIQYPQKLIGAGFADKNSLAPYAVGRLVLWTMNDKLDVNQGLVVLKNPAVTRIAIANPEHAPYGKAAQAALEKAGIWNEIQKKVVLGENISQTAQYVETGNADVGLVAWSLLKAPAMQGKGKSWLLPLDAFPKLEQAAVLITNGANSALAKKYMEFLRSDEAKTIFAQYGFTLPES
jgi:molybdate transport system substrate-binding protein